MCLTIEWAVAIIGVRLIRNYRNIDMAALWIWESWVRLRIIMRSLRGAYRGRINEIWELDTTIYLKFIYSNIRLGCLLKIWNCRPSRKDSVFWLWYIFKSTMGDDMKCNYQQLVNSGVCPVQRHLPTLQIQLHYIVAQWFFKKQKNPYINISAWLASFCNPIEEIKNKITFKLSQIHLNSTKMFLFMLPDVILTRTLPRSCHYLCFTVEEIEIYRV